jgi:hypothetical protein
MVLVDGHDSAWTSRFRSAVVDDSIAKLSFLHMNLNSVPWKVLLSNRRRQKWQTVEVVDCRRLESGLSHLLAINIERIYISSSVLLSRHFGQILGLGLWESKYLRQLHLSSCTWSVDCMKEVIEGLQATCVLEELNLSYTNWNKGGDECVQYFARGMANNSTIKRLELSRCRLSDSQVAYLVEHGLMRHGCLEDLCLGGNTLKQQAMQSLAIFVSNPGCQLKTLELSNPQNYEDPGNYQSTLLQSLPRNTSLRVLQLASNKLTDEHMEELALSVARSNITTLDLKSNNFTDAGIEILAAGLPPQLERLWLQGNPFGVEGAQALYETLRESHCRLIDLRIPTYSTLAPVPMLMTIQKEIHFYEALNTGGRRILMTDRSVPLGLWPLVFERINQLNFENGLEDFETLRVDVLYVLLHGPVLLDRSCKPSSGAR